MARGLFAELNRIAKQAAKEAERANRRAEAERVAAIREAEAADKQAARAQAQDQKRLEKEAKQAHVDAQVAVVEEMNAELAAIYGAIDTLLLTALREEHALDLENLRATVVHPPFDRPELEAPIPKPSPAREEPRPILNLPAAPTGLSALLGKRKHERQVEAAKLAHEQALEAWVSTKLKQKQDFEQAMEDHHAREAERLETLEPEMQRYADECRAREAQVLERNQALDQLIADLGYGVPEAIEEYVSLVLENSDYPECFPISSESSFDPATAELALRVLIPPPDSLPTIKAHKYAKAKDEISATQLSQKACKDRYTDAVHQVALRSLHEVFRADRRGLINTITLEVGTETIDPATGHEVYIPFVATGAERETFMGFDLAGVLPVATLKHMGASVSKNPFGLEGTDTSGIRGA